MQVVRVALLLSALGLTGGHGAHHPTHLAKRSQRMCGDQLIAALRLVCNGVYNKRTDQHSHEREEEWASDEQQEWGEGSVWLMRSSAVGMPGRVRRGVVDECCDKPCSYSELSSYCLVSPATRPKQ